MNLPNGLQLFRKLGVSDISSVAELTCIPGTAGFELAPDQTAPGGDVFIAILSSLAEATGFQAGFDHANVGDASAVGECVFSPDGDLHVVIVHYSDSGDDNLVVRDYRQAEVHEAAAV